MKTYNAITEMSVSFLFCLGLIVGMEFVSLGQNVEAKKRVEVTLTQLETENERQTIASQGPEGVWSVAFVPDRVPLYYKAPVAIVGTKTLVSKTNKNLQLTDVTIANFFDKPIAAVSIRWILFSAKDPKKPLAFDHTGFFKAEIKAKGTSTIACPLVDFGQFVANKSSELPKEFWDKNALNGNFQIKFGIQEVVFADGSIWHEADMNLDVIWDSPAPSIYCPNTQCSYNTPDNRAKCAGGESGTTQGLYCVRSQPCINQYCTCNTYLCGYNDN